MSRYRDLNLLQGIQGGKLVYQPLHQTYKATGNGQVITSQETSCLLNEGLIQLAHTRIFAYELTPKGGEICDASTQNRNRHVN